LAKESKGDTETEENGKDDEKIVRGFNGEVLTGFMVSRR